MTILHWSSRLTIFVAATFLCYSGYEYILDLVIGDISSATAKRSALTPTITTQNGSSLLLSEYRIRRWKLFKVLHETFRNVEGCDVYLVVLKASTAKIKSGDIEYPFHQDTDFFYLTGLDVPDEIALFELYKTNNGNTIQEIKSNDIKYLLFSSETNQGNEYLWETHHHVRSSRAGTSNPDRKIPLVDFKHVFSTRYSGKYVCLWSKSTTKLKNLLDIENFMVKNRDIVMNDTRLLILNRLENNFNNISNVVLKDFPRVKFLDISYYIHILRLVKSRIEISLMKESTRRTVSGFVEVMQSTRAGQLASQIAAKIEYSCKSQGAEFIAFAPVISSGTQFARASLHSSYEKHCVIQNGDLLLLDAGCEYNGYTSDVTRTWPIGGKFTNPQKELYEIVIKTIRKCIKNIRVGTNLERLNNIMLFSLAEGLQNIGLIPKFLSELEELKREASRFCPHYVGHYIGMNVHDTPLIHNELPLQSGMVITVEPGLYVPYSQNIPNKYKGLKIRVEDVVVVTDNEPLVLTDGIPKEINVLEELVG